MSTEEPAGNEFEIDPETGSAVLVHNATDLPNDIVRGELIRHPEVAALTKWVRQVQARTAGSLFQRDRWVNTRRIWDQMALAADAASTDDVVGGFLDMTENLAFNRVDLEGTNEGESDFWNQIAGTINLDLQLRRLWRDVATYSQVYVGVRYGMRTYRAKGTGAAGRRSRKSVDIWAPTQITTLDPFKILPVGDVLWGEPRLVYLADRDEAEIIDKRLQGRSKALASRSEDPYQQMFVRRYQLSPEDSTFAKDHNADLGTAQYLLDPRHAFRHTLTRPGYERMATVRMASVFELLDLKAQLRSMDRTHLIGAANFIILIKKGTEAHPGKAEEIAALQSQAKQIGRIPIFIGDHRLNIEILTPKIDVTLQPDRYNGLDARTTARLFGVLASGNFSAGTRGDDSIKLSRVIARGLSSRRHMMKRSLEEMLLRPIVEANPDVFSDLAKIRFHPKRIELDWDATLAQFLLELRDRNDLSRETILEEVDFDQETEFRRRQREAKDYDQVFQSRSPWGPGGNQIDAGTDTDTDDESDDEPRVDPRSAGRNLGGRRNGGGAPSAGTGPRPGPTSG